MDRDQWKILSAHIHAVTRRVVGVPRVVYRDALILKMYFWALHHERPLYWACDKANYRGVLRPRGLPSVSQFCRRLADDRTQRLLQALQDRLAGSGRGTLCVDGKPLTVGACSKDRHAKRGYAAGQIAKGYKLHAVVDERRRLVSWGVTPLNTHEMPVAGRLLEQLPPLGGALVLADKNYDAAKLHKAVAARGGHLLTPLRGEARHPVTRRQMGAARRVLIGAWRAMPSITAGVYRGRVRIESTFSSLCSTAGGLTHLPPWVRTLGRVRRYVGGKIILYHARLLAKEAKLNTGGT